MSRMVVAPDIEAALRDEGLDESAPRRWVADEVGIVRDLLREGLVQDPPPGAADAIWARLAGMLGTP
jgi:hypothetical protein